DGRKLVYSSMSGKSFTLRLKDLETGKDEELWRGNSGAGLVVINSWSSDGRMILFNVPAAATRGDIWWMSLADRKPQPYLATEFHESNARFSPDGKWIAYQSNETGPSEIYIAPFPPTGAKWQVSTAGGVVPRWRADGKELYFFAPGSPTALW